MFIDRRNRFAPGVLGHPDIAPDRLAAGASGPVWVLDRAARRLAVIDGEPLPALMENQPHASDIFHPHPKSETPRYLFPSVTLPNDREIIAIAADDSGRALVLMWPAVGDAEVAAITSAGIGRVLRLAGVEAPFTLGWLGREVFAVGTLAAREAIPFAFPAADEMPLDGALQPAGGRRPLIGWGETRFLSGPAAPCAYFSSQGATLRARRLHELSLPHFAAAARVPGRTADSGVHGFTWHRLYLEAALPQGTAARVFLGASDDETALAGVTLHPHSFGARDGAEPEGTALPYASEIPFHPGLSGCDAARLHTALIQQSDEGARPLTGRYLRVEFDLTGNGQDTPLIYALRAWGPRFSYRDRYLPELYHDPAAPGANFLDRYLALFESVLTPLEDQVADAWRLTRPGTAPADALDWLASWIGLGLDPGLSEPQKRRMIREATALWRWRGTLVGLQRMLDVVTDDGVRRGDFVVVEHFRLRRTFATILGADLAPSEDPLTRGTAVSGNSLIGPTFYLGAPEQKEFFALFRPELLEDPLTSPDERTRASAAVAELLEHYANRVTVLVHGDAGDDHFNLIRRVVERECPAHVEPRVLRARRPLIVGLTSLLAVNSYLRPRPPRPDVREETARFGQAFLTDTASLDPRIEGGHA